MRRRPLTTEYRRGFTLIELLVVIAIIAILAAVLFPVFAAVRKKASETNCLSNMKQITFGVIAYCSDHDDGGPMTTWPIVDGVEVEHPWFAKLGEYGCPYYIYSPGGPIYTTKNVPCKVNPIWLCTGGNVTSSYNLPYHRGGYYMTWRLGQLRQPSEVGLVFESPNDMRPGYFMGVYGLRGQWRGMFHPKQEIPPDQTFCPDPPSPYYSAHRAGMNLTFADGHAKWVSQVGFKDKFDVLWSDYNWQSPPG